MADPAHQSLVYNLRRDPALGECTLHPPEPTQKPSLIIGRNETVGWECPIADENSACLGRENREAFFVDFDAQPVQEFGNHIHHGLQFPSVVVAEYEIIAVANVPADLHAIREPMIERIEIPVGEPLARQIADGQTLAALAGSK